MHAQTTTSLPDSIERPECISCTGIKPFFLLKAQARKMLGSHNACFYVYIPFFYYNPVSK